MIAALSGTLVDILGDGSIIDVQGIGYRVFMPSSSVAKLPSRGTKITLQTHLHVREDALTLFGFSSVEERDLFEVLIGVNGIGPKAALAVLSANTPGALRKAVLAEDVAALTAIPGIGKKTAARLVLELKEKLGVPDLTVVLGDGDPRAGLAEVREALLHLGYSPVEARDAIERLDPDDDDVTVEELLRVALREMAAR